MEKFSEDEKKIISKEENIITIHRFIEDSEMVWLYQRCLWGDFTLY